ncbi:hypothetical protein B0T18DRAFT_125368 [Schizothecium vesticola]|uniref:Secreted protein n=1 Tax=Schizothecium vesticola TaxID=314040 RepID=A0AA40F360_9PEZI|nr:hypothetical protein B0T18DRAFT_125368 [Schizothecium vesticola]
MLGLVFFFFIVLNLSCSFGPRRGPACDLLRSGAARPLDSNSTPTPFVQGIRPSSSRRAPPPFLLSGYPVADGHLRPTA